MSESVYLIGESRTNLDNAITKIFNSFYLAFEVDPETDQILQFGCTHTVDLTETFLSRLFVGQNLWERKETLEAELNRRYGGSSKRRSWWPIWMHQTVSLFEGSRAAAFLRPECSEGGCRMTARPRSLMSIQFWQIGQGIHRLPVRQ